MKRHDDPAGSDYADQRTNGLEAGFGSARVAARGPFAIVGLLVAISLSTLIYVNWVGLREVRDEIINTRTAIYQSNKGHDLMACVISMSAVERTESKMARTRGDFMVWCPWLEAR